MVERNDDLTEQSDFARKETTRRDLLVAGTTALIASAIAARPGLAEAATAHGATDADITALALKIADIDERLSKAEKLEEKVASLSLSEPVITDSMSSILAQVVEYNRSQKFANIAFFTDTHSNQRDASESIATMNALLASKMMNACVHGGDLISTYELTYQEYIKAMCENMNDYKKYGDMFFVKGNHDYNHTDVFGEHATNHQYHMMMQSSMPGAVFNRDDPCSCYYYYDCSHEKVRIIALDSYTVEGDFSTVCMDDVQLDWLYRTALNVGEGWTVIVFSHNFNSKLSKACDIFNAFNNRGTQYGSYIFDPAITTHFVGVVHGHRHKDDFSTELGFNVISVLCAFSENGAVDILTIDTASKVLYETRIGDGSSRTFSFA